MLMQGHKEFVQKTDKLMAEHIAFEKKKYEENKAMMLEDRKLMQSWMEQQKEESQGMLNIMSEMVGILKTIKAPQAPQQVPQWQYNQVETSAPPQGYAGTYATYQPSDERSLQYHQL
jgi:hypothetical protein